jgi:class 3 adenylate cyclase
LLFDGTAQLLARERDLPAHTLAIWDGAKGDGPGGTATFVAHAVHRGRDVLTIHPQTLRRVCPTRKHVVSTRNFKWSKFGAGEFVLEHRLLAFLFADAKGFSAMRETQVPAFARVVLHLVKRAMPRVPLVLNTWGDGIFIVTHKPRDCAEIAVRLLEAAQSVDPRIEGLPGALTFRIGIHAGPAYFTGCDPVTGRPNAYGRDVSLAARIEPVVDPPGQIWASAAFVRLAEATGIDGFQFKRLPPVTLAKGAGKLELHQLTRRAGGSSGATPLK